MSAERGRNVGPEAERTPTRAPATTTGRPVSTTSSRFQPLPSRANILALQVTAGNAAVTQLVQRQSKGGSGITVQAGPGGLPWPTRKGKPTHWVMRYGEVTPQWLREQGYLRVKGMGDMWEHPETGDSVHLFPAEPPTVDEEPEPAPPPPETPEPPPKDLWEPQDEDSGLLAEMRAEAARIMAKTVQLGGMLGILIQMRLAGEGRTPEYDAQLAELEALDAEITSDSDEFNAQIPAWREEARIGEEEDMAAFDNLVQFVSGAAASREALAPTIDDLKSNRDPPAEEPADQDDEPAPADEGGGGGGGGAPAADEGAGGAEQAPSE